LASEAEEEGCEIGANQEEYWLFYFNAQELKGTLERFGARDRCRYN
jgi:hypothetical protein